MSRFITELAYEPAARPDYFVLLSPLEYFSDHAAITITAPAGFETNFVTGRKLLVVRRIVQDKMNAAAVVHDTLYDTGCVPRAVADEVFYEAMLVLGVARWRAWLAWSAVRLCGAKFYHIK